MNTTLPTDSEARKQIPLRRGLFRYFPAALAGVARWSMLGNQKHNPGEELHHARGKSMDHGDCIDRHLTDIDDMIAAYERGPDKIDTQLILDEADAQAWRALALSQELHERFGGAPLAPGARLPPKPLTFKEIPFAGESPAKGGEITCSALSGSSDTLGATDADVKKAPRLCHKVPMCPLTNMHTGPCI